MLMITSSHSVRHKLINSKFAFQLQLYYYMQKVASAGMGNPKERKECPICGKTLYDRSTWNRHMRIHTGEQFSIFLVMDLVVYVRLTFGNCVLDLHILNHPLLLKILPLPTSDKSR